MINWELRKPAVYRPSVPSLGAAVAGTPGGVDAYAEATLLLLHRDGDVGQLTARAAGRPPAAEEEAKPDRPHPGLGSRQGSGEANVAQTITSLGGHQTPNH